MKNERKKLWFTIVLLLVLIVIMVVSQKSTPRALVTDEKNQATSTVEYGASSSTEMNEDADVEGNATSTAGDSDITPKSSTAKSTKITPKDKPTVIVKGTGDIQVEDITDQVQAQKRATRRYHNPGIGLSYDYPADWTNDEKSVPGVYTVRVKHVLNETDVARVDFRYNTAVVNRANGDVVKIAGRRALSVADESGTYTTLTIPVESAEEGALFDGEQTPWSGKVITIVYGVYANDGGESARPVLFTQTMGDFNVILQSLKMK